MKRVLYKAEMHCQHKRKKLTPKQQQKAAEAKSKNARKILTHDNREKKTDCPSRMTVTVLNPLKKDHFVSGAKSYLVTHPTVIEITFNHNHPIDSAHVLSFRPIAPKYSMSCFERDIQLLLLTTGTKLSSILMEVRTKFY